MNSQMSRSVFRSTAERTRNIGSSALSGVKTSRPSPSPFSIGSPRSSPTKAAVER